MIVDRKELLNVLSVVKPALSSKNVEEHYDDFVFTGERVVTYNDNMFISHPFATEKGFMVTSNIFQSTLTRLSEDRVSITIGKDKVKVKSKNTKAEIATVQDEKHMAFVSGWEVPEEEGKFKKVPQDFLDGLRLCFFSASKDETEKVLKFVSVSGDSVVSSDDVRISKYVMESEFDGSILLHPSVASELIKYGVEKYYVKDPWIYFLCENDVLFCSRVSLSEYHDVGDFFEFKGTTFSIPNEVEECVEKVMVVLEERFDIDKEITVNIGKNKLVCIGEGPQGKIESRIELQYKREEISFKVNPIFFLEAMQGGDVEFKISEDRSRVVFESDNFQHLMAL